MLNISGLGSGYVIDHVPAGLSMEIYSYLGLSRYGNTIAIIKNARSTKMGKKDIIKMEGFPDGLNLDVLSIFGDDINVNVIKNGVVTEKFSPQLPDEVCGIFKCKNPRCITSSERGLVHVFKLTDRSTKTYRCKYCEQAYKHPGD